MRQNPFKPSLIKRTLSSNNYFTSPKIIQPSINIDDQSLFPLLNNEINNTIINGLDYKSASLTEIVENIDNRPVYKKGHTYYKTGTDNISIIINYGLPTDEQLHNDFLENNLDYQFNKVIIQLHNNQEIFKENIINSYGEEFYYHNYTFPENDIYYDEEEELDSEYSDEDDESS